MYALIVPCPALRSVSPCTRWMVSSPWTYHCTPFISQPCSPFTVYPGINPVSPSMQPHMSTIRSKHLFPLSSDAGVVLAHLSILATLVGFHTKGLLRWASLFSSTNAGCYEHAITEAFPNLTLNHFWFLIPLFHARSLFQSSVNPNQGTDRMV